MACAHGVFYTRLGRFDRRVAVGIFNLPGTWGYAKSASVRVEFWDKASGGFIGFQCQYLRSDMASDLWKTVTVVADSLEKIGITLCVTDVVVWLARFVATVASTGVSASLLPLALIAGGFIAGVVAYSSGQLINWYYQSRVLHVSTNGFIPP
ncbi:MAG: hypothetical protein LBI69_02220 [Puniceicoccales bacterium]|nr:hypothetical protein [Puniceicoccales bacterium]